jgi:hypothetical protein
LEIHDRFFPVTLNAGEVDVDGMRIVDLEQEPAWRPVLRTRGFSNTHYQSGWFRAANGAGMRMYRSGGARVMVLLPAKGGGAPVLFQAKDPEEFMQEVRRTWARPAQALRAAGEVEAPVRRARAHRDWAQAGYDNDKYSS